MAQRSNFLWCKHLLQFVCFSSIGLLLTALSPENVHYQAEKAKHHKLSNPHDNIEWFFIISSLSSCESHAEKDENVFVKIHKQHIKKAEYLQFNEEKVSSTHLFEPSIV